jgi:hypothetical protein
MDRDFSVTSHLCVSSRAPRRNGAMAQGKPKSSITKPDRRDWVGARKGANPRVSRNAGKATARRLRNRARDAGAGVSSERQAGLRWSEQLSASMRG